MATGDGLLVRLTLAADLSPAQLAELAAAAGRLGNGLVEISSRGNLQFRGFTRETAATFANVMDDAEIATRDDVVVKLSPFAELDDTAIADPRPIANCIEAAIDEENLSRRIAVKTSIVVDGGDSFGLDMIKADVRLRACTPDLWALSVGDRGVGHMSTARAASVVIQTLERLARQGRDARGIDVTDMDLAGLDGLLTHASPAPRDRVAIDPVGLLELGSNRTVGLVAAFGETSASALAAVAKENVRSFRLGPGGLLLAIGPADPGALIARARKEDFIVASDDPRRGIAACPGDPGCTSGRIPARKLAALLAAQASLPREIHVAGCEKGCARHSAAAVTIVGTKNGVDVVFNGTTRDRADFSFARSEPISLVENIRKLVANELL